jgi:DNA-binding CsgD family transcriptional regulator
MLVTIDDRMRDALARLTENEKECLRRRLQQQTAKEMAIELGISPHAVEKRLKMARTKVGLPSSLEAARLLDALEGGYGRTVPQASDLENRPAGEDGADGSAAPPIETRRDMFRRNALLVSGGILMSLAAAAILAIALQSPGTAPGVTAPVAQVTRSERPAIMEHFEPSELLKATPTEMAMMIQNTFSLTDKDRDGYIEPDETPVTAAASGEVEQPTFTRDKEGHVKPLGVRRVSVEQARAEYIAVADTNRDGRLDFVEYRLWMTPIIAKHGIPAKWRADIEQTYHQ